MIVLKAFGWIFLPFIMIFVQWKRLSTVTRLWGLLWAFIVIFIGVVSSFSDEPVDITIESLALKNTALVGEIGTIYRADTEYKNDDGSYIIVNIDKVQFKPQHAVNTGETLSNVIVISTAGDHPKNFVEKVAYFSLFDATGKELNVGDIFTQTGKELNEIILGAENSTDTSSVKYILIGGFDDSTSGNSKLIFEVK